MSMRRTLILGSLAWIFAISLLHGIHEPRLCSTVRTETAQGAMLPPFRVDFIPVTCHLTCPVTNFINRKTDRGWHLPADPIQRLEDAIPGQFFIDEVRDGTRQVAGDGNEPDAERRRIDP